MRADASPCMVLMDDGIADTLRDIKILARSYGDLSSSGMLRSVYRDIGCPETSVSDHNQRCVTTQDSEDHILPDTSQIICFVTQLQLLDI